jgi:hypothetical protein
LRSDEGEGKNQEARGNADATGHGVSLPEKLLAS